MKFAFLMMLTLTLSAGFGAGSAFAKTVSVESYCNISFSSAALEQESSALKQEPLAKISAQTNWISQLRTALEDRSYRVVDSDDSAALRVEAVSFFCVAGGTPQVPCTIMTSEILVTDLESNRASRIEGSHAPLFGRASRAVAFSSMLDSIPVCSGPSAARVGQRSRF